MSSSQKSSSKRVDSPTMSPDGKFKIYMVNGQKFEVNNHYDLVKVVGCGAYGTVCSGVDSRTGKKVAIKKMAGVFDDLIDGRRILREMKVLRRLEHPNILRMRCVLEPRDPDTFNEVYVVTDLMDSDLQAVLKSRQKLLDAHHRYFMVQLMRAVKYAHSANIVHRDIKPSNLLVNANCDLKLCDFGLARSLDNAVLTGYVVTRWYRAPELLVLSNRYSFPVDTWSCGCILGELLLGKPLFQGVNYMDQLARVLRIVGAPTEPADYALVSDEARRFIESLGPLPRANFADIFPGAAPEAVSFLDDILKFNPDKRLKPADTLKHAYLVGNRKEKYEIDAPEQINFQDDAEELVEARLRKEMYNVIMESAAAAASAAPAATAPPPAAAS